MRPPLRAYSSTHEGLVACVRLGPVVRRSRRGLRPSRTSRFTRSTTGFSRTPTAATRCRSPTSATTPNDVTIAPGAEQQLRAHAGRSHAADHVQAGPLALSVRDGGGPGVRRQDEMDADLRRRHDRHQRADAAIELEPASKARRRCRRSTTRRCRKACASINRRRSACSASRRGRTVPADVVCRGQRRAELFGSAHDEGLPRGKGLVVEWKMLKGPGTVTFTIPGIGAHEGDVLRARPLRARADRHRFRVRRTNARFNVTRQVRSARAD